MNGHWSCDDGERIHSHATAVGTNIRQNFECGLRVQTDAGGRIIQGVRYICRWRTSETRAKPMGCVKSKMRITLKAIPYDADNESHRRHHAEPLSSNIWAGTCIFATGRYSRRRITSNTVYIRFGHGHAYATAECHASMAFQMPLFWTGVRKPWKRNNASVIGIGTLPDHAQDHKMALNAARGALKAMRGVDLRPVFVIVQ